ncbi:MAG: glycosyltransferase family 2 protein [Cyanobacteria bacterium J06554_11]
MENILVIIPVLNEADTITGVLAALRRQGLEKICVVDNGSCDRTPQTAAEAGAQVVLEPRRGYGQACWTGLQTPESQAADWILFCDGDGSDDLGELPKLLALRDQCDFVLGNRRGTAGGRSQLSAVQNFGNWLATRLIRVGWGYRYEDLGPLRLIRRAALDRLGMVDRGFGWTVEMQAKAAEQGLKICEIPVNYLPRQGGRSKIAGTLRGSANAGQVILTTLAVLYWQKVVGRRLGHLFPSENFLEKSTVQKGLLWVSALLLVLGSLLAAPYGDFLNDPEAVPLFWRGAALMSLGFVGSWGLGRVSPSWFWAVTIAPRLILLAMHPGDDIWRYLWEGHIQNQGFNPYLLPPTADVLIPFRLDSWSQINHLDHAAIYPPVAQLGFRLLAFITPSVLLFKSAFVAADLAICCLLSRRFGAVASLLYAWNPMVIYSFAGGGHYDSWFLLPLVVAWLWWERALKESGPDGRRINQLVAAVAVGLSIAVKWMSLPVLGFVAWRARGGERFLGLRRWSRQWPWLSALLLLAVGLLPLAVAVLPFCQISDRVLSCPIVPLDSPFINYGRSAALLPQLVAKLWPASVKANWIYGLPLAITVLWGLASRLSIRQFTERYLIALMLLSPIVHAWYFTWLTPFAVASRNWGTRLVSVSAFVYFALPRGLALGTGVWRLDVWQRWVLWAPFVVGLLYSAWILPKPVSRTYFVLSDNSD